MAWMKHSLQLSVEDKMAAEAFGCGTNYGPFSGKGEL